MSTTRAGPLLIVLLLAALSPLGAVACGSTSPADGDESGGAAPAADRPLRVLVLSGGAYHDFDGNLARLLDGMAFPHGVHWTFLPLGELDPDGVPAELRRRQLGTLDLPAEADVVLAYTQGELGLGERAKERLLAFVEGGGGFVGLHCAADSHPGWDAYTRMLGGRFLSHPPYGALTVDLDGAPHPVTDGLPASWTLEDEFYHLADLHLEDAAVLMSAACETHGVRHPATWVKAYGKGRVAYTFLGHGPATHGDARFRRLVRQALAWAAAARPGD